MRQLIAIVAAVLLTSAPLGCSKKRGTALADTQPGSPGAGAVASGPPASATDIPELPAVSYQRSLVELLDLVPAEASGFMVVRDGRPLLDHARRARRIADGPLREILRLASKLADSEFPNPRFDEPLAKFGAVLDAIDGAGLELERGAVVGEVNEVSFLLLPTTNLAGLKRIVKAVGNNPKEVDRRCRVTRKPAGFVLCHKRSSKAKGIQPGGQGSLLLGELERSFPGVELASLNTVLSIPDKGERIRIALGTYPGLVYAVIAAKELDKAEQGLTPGPAPTLAVVEPGGSFVWARADVRKLLDKPPPPPFRDLALTLTGEVFLGSLSNPASMLALVGITDRHPASGLLEEVAREKDKLPKTIPGQPNSEVTVALESISVPGRTLRALHLWVTGLASEQTIKNLYGMTPEAIAFALDEYLVVGAGTGQTLAHALADRRFVGLSVGTAQTLPPPLARALIAGQASSAFHLGVDALQQVMDPAALAPAITKLPPDKLEALRRLAAAVPKLFVTVSGYSAWTTHAQGHVLFHTALVTFGDGTDAAGKAETEAIAAVLAGQPAAKVFADLAKRHPDSPRALSYQVRAGQVKTGGALLAVGSLGVLSAIAIPAFVKYIRRSKTAEARVHLAKMFDAVAAHYTKHGRCPRGGAPGPTPPLSVNCNDGPGGKCVPAARPKGKGSYRASLWTKNRVWRAIGFAVSEPHAFHYNFRHGAVDGQCVFTAQAFGDLDDDGIWSTFERAGAADKDGVNAAVGLYIDQELE